VAGARTAPLRPGDWSPRRASPSHRRSPRPKAADHAAPPLLLVPLMLLAEVLVVFPVWSWISRSASPPRRSHSGNHHRAAVPDRMQPEQAVQPCKPPAPAVRFQSLGTRATFTRRPPLVASFFLQKNIRSWLLIEAYAEGKLREGLGLPPGGDCRCGYGRRPYSHSPHPDLRRRVVHNPRGCTNFCRCCWLHVAERRRLTYLAQGWNGVRQSSACCGHGCHG
jgi:hypothetical protein